MNEGSRELQGEAVLESEEQPGVGGLGVGQGARGGGEVQCKACEKGWKRVSWRKRVSIREWIGRKLAVEAQGHDVAVDG